jgi:hypothetical protein
MADNKTRRVIEVQSDLYQKGNLEREVDVKYRATVIKDVEIHKLLTWKKELQVKILTRIRKITWRSMVQTKGLEQ